ncbi:hypothetical protein DLP3_067 [Stenotrophomonas phage vB_SmaS_DLP_3]|nr:hypothetical protein DLP3_067 [Stenotrophomonas phage vB_SmaS_DLP_3]
MPEVTPAQASALKHAAHEWANLSACAAAKRGGPWKKHKDAVASRDNAKQKFLALLAEVEVKP